MKPSTAPIATLLLIAVNILAAFLILWQPHLVDDFGFTPSKPSFQGLLTSLFLHQNVLHLLGNMLFLAAVGPAVESGGTIRFVCVYFAAGICGVLAHWALASGADRTLPLIGASGAVAGCIAYYSLRYLRVRVFVAPKIGVPILAVTFLWLALQVAGAFVTIGFAAGGTAYWAHLGGFAAGLALSAVLRAPRLARQEIGHQVLERMDSRSPGAKLTAAEMHLKEHPGDMKALWDKADALASLNDHDQEAQVLLEVFERGSEQESRDALVRLAKTGYLGMIPSKKRTLLAERLKTDDPDLSRILLLSVVEGGSGDSERPDALLALAALEFQVSESHGKPWIQMLLTEYPMHPACDLARLRGWAP
ncbi:MAG TPA: rhomboid family intramembrane serine protease [Fimbriimonadaceae bacterium]|nr:rhomboid family intramembrane serine protease [Fimbriimonadaceae bacterium]